MQVALFILLFKIKDASTEGMVKGASIYHYSSPQTAP